jgi:Double zinc ribbon
MMEVASRLFTAVALPCGHENPDDNVFCDVCGGSRPSRCPLCQAINRGTANFCGKCGVRLPESPTSDGAPGSSEEARTALQTHGVSGEITVSESDTAVADPVSERPPPEGARAARGSGPPAEPEPRVELESSKGAVAMDRSKDEVRPIEDLARSARVTRHQSSRLQSEGREPIRPDGDETRADLRLERFLVECRGRAEKRRRLRALQWGILAAAALGILLVAIVFDAEVWRGGNSSRSVPRLEPSQTPATSKAPAASVASQPPSVAEWPSPTERVPVPVVPEPPPPRVEPPPLPAGDRSTPPGQSNRGAAAFRRSGAAVDSLHVIAGSLIAKLGREGAEETARANATLYAPGSETFVYWQRVADAIRTAKVPR